MPKGLRRRHGGGERHFITCSCYHRMQFLGSARRRDVFLKIQNYRQLVAPALGEMEIETASPGVDLSWKERRSDAGTWSESARTRKGGKPTRRRSERPAILAQAILLVYVVASMFNRWAA